MALIVNWKMPWAKSESYFDNHTHEMLLKVRESLALSLEEMLRLEDEGGNPPPRGHANDNEKIAQAIRRIDNRLPAENPESD